MVEWLSMTSPTPLTKAASYVFKLEGFFKQTMKALVLVSCSTGKSDKIRGEIMAIKGVKEAIVVTGRTDVAVLVGGSLKEINRAVKSIFRVKGVVATESLLEVV